MNGSFTFFESFHGAAQVLPPSERLKFYEEIINFGVAGVEPSYGDGEGDNVRRALFIMATPNITQNIKRRTEGSNAANKRWSSPPTVGTHDGNVSPAPTVGTHDGNVSPAPTVGTHDNEWNGMDRNGMDKNKNTCSSGDERECDFSENPVPPTKPKRQKATVDDPNFVRFWDSYPKKVSKAAALKAWRKINPGADMVEAIITGLERAKTTKQFQGDPEYIPHPATWLNGKRWEDECGAETLIEEEIPERVFYD